MHARSLRRLRAGALRRLLEYISLALDGDQLKYLRKVISPTSKVISYEVRLLRVRCALWIAAAHRCLPAMRAATC